MVKISKEQIINNEFNLIDLEEEDLWDNFGAFFPDLIFDLEHYNKNNFKLLECKNCRLGDNLYLLIFNEIKTLFCSDSSPIIENEKILFKGWDKNIKISLKNGEVKLETNR